MTCLDENELSSHLARRLGAEETARVAAHLDECPRCADLLAMLARAYPAEPSVGTVTKPVTAGAQGTPSITTDDTAPHLPDVALDAPPAAIGRYVIVGPLGSGGMGVVFAAYDPKLDRKVAIKVLRQRATSEEAARDAQSMLMREARTMARVSHPNVLAVHDVGAHEGHVFLVMDLVDGGTLRDWLRGQTRTPADILGVVIEAGRGLAAAQRAGLVHRDFKPDNVLVSREGRVFVADFGLTRRAPAAGALQDVREGWAGTPAYVAPEVKRGRAADARSDQFSFCVTLHEALFGERPHGHFGDTPPPNPKPVSPGVSASYASPASVASFFVPPTPAVPSEVRSALARGLAEDPEARFETMETLLAALTPFAAQAALAVTSGPGSQDTRPGLAPARRRWVTAAVAAGVLGGSLLAAALLGPKPLGARSEPAASSAETALSELVAAKAPAAASSEPPAPASSSAAMGTAEGVAQPGAPSRGRPRSSPARAPASTRASAGRLPAAATPTDPLARHY